MKRTLIAILLLLSVFVVKSQDYENLQVSLLTVKSRPNEVYTVFGHTALRLVNRSTQEDIVFNWGTFNFDEPNFLFRFVKGETDYRLSTTDYDSFCFAYSMGNSTVVEQVLNFSEEEKRIIWDLLSDNLLPQNRIYRYNFLFDNCTTRVRDIFQTAYGDGLHYPSWEEKTTYRELIHSCTNPYPWLTFGIDLVIGSGADSVLHLPQELFLPEKLMDALQDSWVISANGERIPVVDSARVVMESEPENGSSFGVSNSPMLIGVLLLALCLALVFIAHKTKRSFSLVYVLLFLMATLGGCVVWFLVFFSIHPCVCPNWNVVWLHPLHLIAVAGYLVRNKYPLFYWYHVCNCILLCLFILAWFLIPQQLNPANVPYVLSLGIVSGYTAYRLKRLKYE